MSTQKESVGAPTPGSLGIFPRFSSSLDVAFETRLDGFDLGTRVPGTCDINSDLQSQVRRKMLRPEISVMLNAEEALERPKRDRNKEKMLAAARQAGRVMKLAGARHDQSLGEEYIKMAQAMILCTLPYSPTKETKITRQARLGDNSILYVTFSAALPNVAMPFGADRKVLAWIFDKAIRLDSPFIPWESAVEYQKEVGITKGGKNNRDLRMRFMRVAGLVINIQREAGAGRHDLTYPVIERSFLPTSITGMSNEDGSSQPSLPELENRFGFVLNTNFFNDIRKHNIVLPRKIWQDIKGPTQVQDIVFWLIFRCYSAAKESVIPWSALREQFPQDTNPHRNRQHVRQAIRTLRAIWPSVHLEELKQGILVNRANEPLLEDDPSKGRIRRLPTAN